MEKRLYKRAEITVFLSLICTVLCGLIYAILLGAKVSLVKLRIETVSDIAARSAFAEYNRELFDKYNLLYVDPTYKGVCSGSISDFQNHLVQYIEANTTTSGDDLSRIVYVSSEITDEKYASSNNYESLIAQIRYFINCRRGYGNYSDLEVLNEYIMIKKEENDEFRNAFYGYFRDPDINWFEYYNEDGKLCTGYSDDDGDHYEFFDEYGYYTDTYNEKKYFNSVSYDDKLDWLKNTIINDMRNTNDGFDFTNLLESATITIYMEGSDGKVYDCKREYGL